MRASLTSAMYSARFKQSNTVFTGWRSEPLSVLRATASSRLRASSPCITWFQVWAVKARTAWCAGDTTPRMSVVNRSSSITRCRSREELTRGQDTTRASNARSSTGAPSRKRQTAFWMRRCSEALGEADVGTGDAAAVVAAVGTDAMRSKRRRDV